MKRINATPISLSTSLLALVAVFAITAGITFGARRALGRSLDTQPTQADLLAARNNAIAAIPRLPKDTEAKLAAALDPQLASITATFSDPLVDRAGIDQAGRANIARMAPVSAMSNLPLTPLVPEKLSRLTQWQLNVRAAYAGGLTPPSITSAYLISEVSPTGRMNTKGAQGVWFYIDAEKRQISANVGSKFYDGVFVSVDPDTVNGGVVFRTSSGQTKIVHWDRQEDFSSTTPATQPAAEGNQQARPQQAIPQLKPVSQINSIPEIEPAKNRPSATSTRSQKATRDDYSDLQVAVQDRYRTQPVNQPINSSSQSDQTLNGNHEATNPDPDGLIIKSTAKATTEDAATQPQSQPETNTFSTGSARTNKLNYAHAVYSSRPKQNSDNDALSFRSHHSPVLNLDDTSSFTANSTSLKLATARYNQEPAPVANQSVQQPAIETKNPTAQTPTKPTEPQATKKDELAKASPQPSPNAATKTTPAPAAAAPAPLTLCHAAYRGENIIITNEANRPISLLNFVNQMNKEYNANIVLDYDVQEIPVRLTIDNAPWTSILRTLLDLNDLDMVCLDGGIVQIAKRSKISAMVDMRRRSAPIMREVFTLRYLQQTSGGRTNLAGQTQAGNGPTIQSLEDAVRDILKAGGDARGEARRVPGRNQLLVAATREQMEDIRDLISRVDRPGYQVKISALVYTANENKLRDIGSQLAIVVGNAQGTNLGGGTTLPPGTTTTTGTGGTGGTGSQSPSGINPGGIPSLASGMRAPSNALGASSPLATFGVTSLFGTAQFSYQLTLAQQKGIVNIQSRPFGYVSDGEPFELVAGSQIPVVTTTIAGGAPFQSGQVQFIEASRITRITPQVAEDEHGNPNYVTLTIQLENNSVDTSLGTFNGVPGVNRQSLQTVLRLKNGETVVIGGLAADQVSNSTSKVPGLGNIPLLGNLFKKKTSQETRDRLYFAITVEVIPLDSPIRNFPAPADATTAPPAAPAALDQRKHN